MRQVGHLLKSSSESNCSMKKKEEWTSNNKNKSKTSSSKNNKYNSNNNTNNNNNNNNNNNSKTTHLLCEPNLRNKYVTKTCKMFYMRLLRLRPALPMSTSHSKAAIINDFITQVEVQMLCLLCLRLSKSRNDHSVEKFCC